MSFYVFPVTPRVPNGCEDTDRVPCSHLCVVVTIQPHGTKIDCKEGDTSSTSQHGERRICSCGKHPDLKQNTSLINFVLEKVAKQVDRYISFNNLILKPETLPLLQNVHYHVIRRACEAVNFGLGNSLFEEMEKVRRFAYDKSVYDDPNFQSMYAIQRFLTHAMLALHALVACAFGPIVVDSHFEVGSAFQRAMLQVRRVVSAGCGPGSDLHAARIFMQSELGLDPRRVCFDGVDMSDWSRFFGPEIPYNKRFFKNIDIALAEFFNLVDGADLLIMSYVSRGSDILVRDPHWLSRAKLASKMILVIDVWNRRQNKVLLSQGFFHYYVPRGDAFKFKNRKFFGLGPLNVWLFMNNALLGRSVP